MTSKNENLSFKRTILNIIKDNNVLEFKNMMSNPDFFSSKFLYVRKKNSKKSEFLEHSSLLLLLSKRVDGKANCREPKGDNACQFS